MFNHEPPPYCEACGYLHEEKTCANYLEIAKASAQDDENCLDSCNDLFEGRKKFPLSEENIQQVKDKSIVQKEKLEYLVKGHPKKKSKRCGLIGIKA